MGASTRRVKTPCHRGDLRRSFLPGRQRGGLWTRGVSVIEPETPIGGRALWIEKSVHGGTRKKPMNREESQCVWHMDRWSRLRCSSLQLPSRQPPPASPSTATRRSADYLGDRGCGRA